MNPKLTVSGYRGVWGMTLTEDIARKYTRAFGMLILSRGGTTMFVARDGRESGPALLEIIADELLSLGLDVIDLDMMATPIIPFLVRSENAGGAVIVTASHNPIEYNGLKFVTETGAFTNEAEVAVIEKLRGTRAKPADRISTRTNGASLFEKYLNSILTHIDTKSIQKKKIKVAFDPINSVGSTLSPQLFEKLGVAYAGINTDPSGHFAHAPEPLPENLTSLSKLVHDLRCDVGFAQDPDGDRLVIVDETGNIPSEETMFALCVKAVLAKTPGDVVINMSTSNMSRDIAESFGHKAFRSKVGEANVVEMMKEKNAAIGGEGGGGVIWPVANLARDSFVGMALILELMARENKPFSELIAALPQYVMQKEKVSFSGNLSDPFLKLENAFSDAEINDLDGVRFDFVDKSWVHIRPSNTEPVVRIIAESKTKERTQELIEIAQKCL